MTADSLAAARVTIAQPRIDGSDLFWLEGRPADGGRVVVVRRNDAGEVSDMTGAPYSVRSRVHEYGGGAYDVADGLLAFCNFGDRRVYVVELASGGEPRPITPEGDLRYGDLRIVSHPGADSPSILAVCEDHSGRAAGEEAVNRLVRLDLGDNLAGGVVLADGHDFVSSATESPDGRWLAWVRWDHPNMPWDDSELCVAALVDGDLGEPRVVAGGPGESVSQPRWAPDGRLVFVSDRTGWWNLYALDVALDVASDVSDDALVALWSDEHDFAEPQWMLATSSYGITDSGRILCSRLVDGYSRLAVMDLATGEHVEVASDAVAVSGLAVGGETALVGVGFSDLPSALVRLDLSALESAEAGEREVVRRSALETLEPAFVSLAEPMTWSSPSGSDVHGFFFAPRNPGFRGLEGELPPLIVMSHGGPTSMTTPAFTQGVQYWTSRGFAILHVNYGGSSGYGRAYRERLSGNWGVVDVDDCASGATELAARGLADPQRLAIEGGSAGGYTTLAALTFRDVFAAGASWFGIGDLEALLRDTHKFESRYGDGLLGPYPEARALYRERSPIHYVDQISCPMILLQGREDPVVPLNQAEEMAAAVRARGLPVALIVFDGEGHGFRRAENIVRAQEAEAYFYSRVFDFTLADDVDPVEIYNLPEAR